MKIARDFTKRKEHYGDIKRARRIYRVFDCNHFRVLNNDPTMSVSESHVLSILEAAGKLHYKSSSRQRRMRVMHSKQLRFAIAEMLSPAEQLADPYYLYLKNYAVYGTCIHLGFALVHLQEQQGLYEQDTAGRIDGVLAIGIFSEEQIKACALLCIG